MMKRTVLYGRHVALGAKMVGFGGWEMPVQYSGHLSEHEAVRRRAGIFDVSHMGEIFISGPGSTAFVNRLQTNDISGMGPGQVVYAVMCNESGNALDDLLVYCLGRDSWLLIVNASNADRDYQWMLSRRAGEKVTVQNRSDDFGLIAVQGPRAVAIVRKVVDFPENLRYYHFRLSTFAGAEVIVSRTGYTGEDGVELMVPTEHTAALWDALTLAGKDEGLLPCGLAARDLLRIEAGYSLYGHELDENTDPVTAGLRWVVKMGHDFVGRDALASLKPSRKKVAFFTEGKNIPRQGYKLFVGDREAGVVTSGTWSPSLQKPVGIGYIFQEKGADTGGRLAVEIRGKLFPAEIGKLPFIKPGVFK